MADGLDVVGASPDPVSIYGPTLRELGRGRRWAELADVAREAIERHPDFAPAHQHLGEALLQLGRFEEAKTSLRVAAETAERPTEARTLLRLAETGALHLRPADIRPWPGNLKHFRDPESLFRQYVLRHLPKGAFIGPDTSFVTLGSCFALHLARRLEAARKRIDYQDVAEEVNSTFANLHVLRWLEAGAIDPLTAQMAEVYGEPWRARLRASIASADVVILTLGVAPCFFDRQTGEFAFFRFKSKTMHDQMHVLYEMRMTGVEENARNIREIAEVIRRIGKPGVKIVLTLSPVPLAGMPGVSSAPVADCLSKSTLRLACEQALAGAQADTHYWPSFEMIRWLGPHLPSRDVYGGDDGDSRHVADWMVDLIVRLFLEHHSS